MIKLYLTYNWNNMFFKEKIIYTDVLEEYRKIKIWDFNLFDKVLIWKSILPYILIWNQRDEIYKTSYVWWYSKIPLKKWNQNLLRWWKIEYEWESYEKITYDLYECINLKWERVTSYEVRKYYWEFQEEFESLDKAIKDEELLKNKIEQIKTLEKSINENYEKAKSIKNKNYKELWIL